MFKTLRLSALMLAITTQVTSLPATAQAGSRDKDLQLFEPEAIQAFGIDVEKYLAARGAFVAIVGRAGQPRNELPDGVRFTHVALWVYSDLTLADGRSIKGYAVHNLYQQSDDPDQSRLFQDYPIDFFAGAHTLDAGIAIPAPALQAKLQAVLADGRWEEMHNPRYSVIANPADPT